MQHNRGSNEVDYVRGIGINRKRRDVLVPKVIRGKWNEPIEACELPYCHSAACARLRDTNGTEEENSRYSKTASSHNGSFEREPLNSDKTRPAAAVSESLRTSPLEEVLSSIGVTKRAYELRT
jgi:hypothetical protein